MIFIHPGGFYGFSGQSANFGPQYLLDKDIVLVTINYRLGTLGNFKKIKEVIIITYIIDTLVVIIIITMITTVINNYCS